MRAQKPCSATQAILDRFGDASFADATALRKALVPEIRALLDEGRNEAERILNERKNGLACAHCLSATMDQAIQTIHDVVITVLYPLNNPTSGERLCVVATGGYGRGTLAPGSDVDLLFLLPYKKTQWSESVVETMLYVLWDLKLKVGHATRSIDECIREAEGDFTTRTAILEARYLTGDTTLYTDLKNRFEHELVKSSAAEFVDAKLRERDRRVEKAGESRYLVEPNVKDGKGGLRDLQTLMWIVRYVFGPIRKPSELVKAAAITPHEARQFFRCEEFLWRVRCHMHFAAGKGEERLTFDLQNALAPRLGYTATTTLSAVEQFMKAYFLVAKEVGSLTAQLCAVLEARHAKRRPMLDRQIESVLQDGSILESGDFTFDNERLTLARGDAFMTDPVNLIRLFWLASRHNAPIHPDALRLASQQRRLIDAALRKNPEANRLFLDILTSRNAPDVVLRLMNEAGVLGRFVTEFGQIVAMMQFSMYHHYTVDEHLLRSIGFLSEIEAGRLQHEHPLASSLTVPNRRELYVAMFLHDIAKGRPKDHSVAGERVARRLCPRFGLSQEETDTVAWLVRNHLLMSNTAQRRDLSDPTTIRNFAEAVQSMHRLKLLLMVTIADIRAVGPGVWTGWKGELLRALYFETEILLGGANADLAHHARMAKAQATLRAALSDWPDEAIDAYLGRHSPAYWVRVYESRRVKHARFVRETELSGRSMAATVETDKFRGATELTVFAPDHPRLLAIITGACAASGGNIVDAQIFTTIDGHAIDTITLSGAFERDEDEMRRGRRIATIIERALKGEVKIADLVESRRPRLRADKPFKLKPKISIDNTLSQKHTVIEISGLDRPGLLYDLTTALARLNLNIASAHIVTFGEKAVDVFYVTDLTGTKILHSGRQTAIRRTLLDVFEPEGGKTASARQASP